MLDIYEQNYLNQYNEIKELKNKINLNENQYNSQKKEQENKEKIKKEKKTEESKGKNLEKKKKEFYKKCNINSKAIHSKELLIEKKKRKRNIIEGEIEKKKIINKDFKEVIDLNDIPVINKDMQNEINNAIKNYNIDNNTKIENSINIELTNYKMINDFNKNEEKEDKKEINK